jgi:hypothetical protein
MKKIIVVLCVKPSNETATEEALVETLRQFGPCDRLYGAEVEVKDASTLKESIWLYASGQEDEPYLLVDQPWKSEGRELSGREVNLIREVGVCTAFYAEYPRADRYGSPIYTADDVFAEGEASNYGFPVAALGVEVWTRDRGDDGVADRWFRLAVTEDLFNDLRVRESAEAAAQGRISDCEHIKAP